MDNMICIVVVVLLLLLFLYVLQGIISLWGLVYLDLPLQRPTPTCPFPSPRLHLQPVFINFSHKAQQQEGGQQSLPRGADTARNIVHGPPPLQGKNTRHHYPPLPPPIPQLQPSAIYKQSFPYAVARVTLLTQGGMLLGGNIVQQWHRSNLGGAVSDSIRAFCRHQNVWPRGPCQACC